MVSKLRFTSERILSNPITLTIGELLDASDDLVKEMAFSMQRATPGYRVRKPTKAIDANQQGQGGTNGALVMAAAATMPPPATPQAFDDDGQRQPVMIVSWVRAFRLLKMIPDEGSLVELIARRVVRRMKPQPQIYNDGHLRVALATDKIDTLTEYVRVPVNVEGVEAPIKAWLRVLVVDVEIYDLLLDLTWTRRTHCNPHFGSGVFTISGIDGIRRQIPAHLTPMGTNLPIVEFDEEEESADRACQHLLDEQENPSL